MLELFVAFGSAKFKYFTIIPDKLNPMSWIQGAGAEAAPIDTHLVELGVCLVY